MASGHRMTRRWHDFYSWRPAAVVVGFISLMTRERINKGIIVSGRQIARLSPCDNEMKRYCISTFLAALEAKASYAARCMMPFARHFWRGEYLIDGATHATAMRIGRVSQ